MAQQALKVKSKQKPRERVTKKQQNPRPAAPRIIKSKNKQLQMQSKLSKNYSVTSQTEKLISSRVGHLELLKGSRRELEKEEKLKKKKEAEKKK